jgi:hypothetical protein
LAEREKEKEREKEIEKEKEIQRAKRKKDRQKEKEAKAKESILQHQLDKLPEHKHHVATATATTAKAVAKASAKVTATVASTGAALTTTATAQPVGSQFPFHAPPPSHGSNSIGDRESTPRRRSEEPQRSRSSRSPLEFADVTLTKEVRHYKKTKKTQRFTEEISRKEVARTTTVEEKRAKSPIFSPDLSAMLVAADAVRRVKGLLAHTVESFLHHLHMQISHPQATHQNAAPQEPMEQDLHRNHCRSQQ